jgi:hypothetical protein
VEPDELDAQRFERLVLLAREAIVGGDPACAIPQLTQALDLWRGPALADVRDIAAARGRSRASMICARSPSRSSRTHGLRSASTPWPSTSPPRRSTSSRCANA